MTRPPSVIWAVRLMQLGGAVSLGILLAVLASSGRNDAPAWAMLASTEVALWLVMAQKIARGRPLARLYGTALAALNVLFTIGLFAGEAGSAGAELAGALPLVTALSLFNAAVGSAVVGIIWTPAAEPFFD